MTGGVRVNIIVEGQTWLVKLYPAYDKLAFGPGIAARIGLDAIRSKCHHFDEWLAKLEGLKPVRSGS